MADAVELTLIASVIFVAATSAISATSKSPPAPGITWFDKKAGSACVVAPDLSYEDAVKKAQGSWVEVIGGKAYRIISASKGGKNDCPDAFLVGTIPAKTS